jgi:catechol 2,3-dioxygenase-like lactoylglutathione lyase family enzyme
MKKPRLQHVSCIVPPGTHEQVRAFYGGVLGLEEKPCPRTLSDRGLVWFYAGDHEMELHFVPNTLSPHPEAVHHFCLEVEEVESYRRRISEAGYTITEGDPIPGRPRFFCRDPFNNLVELTTIESNYLDAQ